MITGKNIVLTGASSGIGLETLKILMKGEGNRILAVARHVDNLRGMVPNVIPFECDVSSAEGVETIFARAEQMYDKIDIFYANAGFPYYEQFNYTDWDRVEDMFRTNTFSPIYTYSRYVKHLNGRDGILAMTVSAIGQMAMPGYAIYSASKFGLEGFQQAIRLEKPKNLQITCLYPVATDTNFFKVANELKFEKPFPVQKPKVVARKMVEGIEFGKPFVFPCTLFGVAKVLMAVVPPVRTLYWDLESAKLRRFEAKVKVQQERIRKSVGEVRQSAEELSQTVREAGKTVAELGQNVLDAGKTAAELGQSVKEKIHGV
jgi:short-subunit dehydrogenase